MPRVTALVNDKMLAQFEISVQGYQFGCHATALNSVTMCWSITNPAATFMERSVAQQIKFDSMPEATKGKVWGALYDDRSKLGGYDTDIWIFDCVVNNGKPSRGGGTAQCYFTVPYIKWLMKNKGGTWWGLPVVQNPYHTNEYGRDMSLTQTVIWKRGISSQRTGAVSYNHVGPAFGDTGFYVPDPKDKEQPSIEKFFKHDRKDILWDLKAYAEGLKAPDKITF